MSPRLSRPVTATQSSKGGYPPGHCWYYKLGGRPLYPKEIRANALASGYRGYDATSIEALDALSEPQRSERLRGLRSEIVSEITRDLSRYRQLLRDLRSEKAKPDLGSCSDTDMSVSLKHNHLYNGFARLAFVEMLLGKQRDLFD